MPTQASNRAYSAPPSVPSISMGFSYDPNVVINGGTGWWVPNSVSGNGLAVTPVASTFTSIVTGLIGTGQIILPLSTKQWSVSVVSGAAWIKGSGPILPGTNIGGGGFDGRSTMASTIAIGATGSSTSTPLVLVAYDA